MLSAEATLPDTTLGAAELEWEYPFETSFGIARVQAIYPAASLGGARRLTSLALKVAKPPATPLRR